MVRRIIAAALLISTLFILGCAQISGLTKPSTSPEPDILKTVKLSAEWQMYQLRVHLSAGGESLVLLRLANQDKVDGFFYLEKGEDTGFQIAGNSLIYESKAIATEGSGKITSGRFSFVASQNQGTTYTLTFRNPTDKNEVVFLEVIYPVKGSLFFPIISK